MTDILVVNRQLLLIETSPFSLPPLETLCLSLYLYLSVGCSLDFKIGIISYIILSFKLSNNQQGKPGEIGSNEDWLLPSFTPYPLCEVSVISFLVFFLLVHRLSS